jgi:hypothetical protein
MKSTTAIAVEAAKKKPTLRWDVQHKVDFVATKGKRMSAIGEVVEGKIKPHGLIRSHWSAPHGEETASETVNTRNLTFDTIWVQQLPVAPTKENTAFLANLDVHV